MEKIKINKNIIRRYVVDFETNYSPDYEQFFIYEDKEAALNKAESLKNEPYVTYLSVIHTDIIDDVIQLCDNIDTIKVLVRK